MHAHIINLKTFQSSDVDYTADKPGQDPVLNSHTHNTAIATHTYTYMKYDFILYSVKLWWGKSLRTS